MRTIIAALFRNQRSGQVLVLFALMLFVLILFLGLAIDFGFAYLTKASLSKSVDSACLMGVRNIAQGDAAAKDIAENAFLANYGVSGRDYVAPIPDIQIVTGSDNGNKSVEVHASSVINTFFIKVIPSFSTLTVAADAAAVRTKVVMSLVLDRSGSMYANHGDTNLPPAVVSFVNQFLENYDRVAVTSFSSYAKKEVDPAKTVFKTAVQTAVAPGNLNFGGWTCSEQGILIGKGQLDAVTIQPDEDVIKILVFFTDGLANTWRYNFNCGARNISPDRTLYDPVTGSTANNSACTIPATIDGVSTTWCALRDEGERRAEAAATIAKNAGIVIYAIGLGELNSPPTEGQPQGCGKPALNPAFMRRVSNDPTSPDFDENQPQGEALFAPDASKLTEVFDTLAKKILSRLTQ